MADKWMTVTLYLVRELNTDACSVGRYEQHTSPLHRTQVRNMAVFSGMSVTHKQVLLSASSCQFHLPGTLKSNA
jgi:hypothetical protein